LFFEHARDLFLKHPRRPTRSSPRGLAVMLAVIGNVLAGIGIVSLFTATLRLTRAGK
jgi:hypothetical protein